MADEAHQVEFSAGEHIESAAAALIAAAKVHGSAQGKFNDVTLTAMAESSAATVLEFYQTETERHSAEYRASPEGMAARSASDKRRSDLQSKHDQLMKLLATLDWSNDVAVLDWLCGMQEPSDHINVLMRRQTIVNAFERQGFNPNENTGKDYRDGDLNNMFRYIVGQALNGLAEGPAIHPIIHRFCTDWKARFRVQTVTA